MDTFEVGPRYLHVVIALGVLATTTVALRLFARWMSKGQFGADDCWVLVGLVFVYGLIVNSGFCKSSQLSGPSKCSLFSQCLLKEEMEGTFIW